MAVILNKLKIQNLFVTSHNLIVSLSLIVKIFISLVLRLDLILFLLLVLVISSRYLLRKILVITVENNKINFQYILNVIIFNFSQNLKVFYNELFDCICIETFDFFLVSVLILQLYFSCLCLTLIERNFISLSLSLKTNDFDISYFAQSQSYS